MSFPAELCPRPQQPPQSHHPPTLVAGQLPRCLLALGRVLPLELGKGTATLGLCRVLEGALGGTDGGRAESPGL